MVLCNFKILYLSAMNKLDEYIEYLSAWCKTRNNTYRPLVTSDIPKILGDIIKSGNTTPIKTFKEKFLNGSISLPTFCIGLSDEQECFYFDKCMEIVGTFEKNHSMDKE
jgi:hypothetical protein